MAATAAVEDIPVQTENWPQDAQVPAPGGPEPDVNGASLTVDGHDPEQLQDYARASSATTEAALREKQIKPNKVYIGGLPEHTRQEDLQNCFGKIGTIKTIELKVGYGFVEFETREAAEESVAKYHEGFFMGNKIRVELSHGGGRTAKFAGEPGACFKCGQMGHWARECPGTGQGHRRTQYYDPPMADRLQRDHNGYPPRPMPPRDDYARFPPRDNRYDYPQPPPVARDYRRPPSPRDYRDYGPPPPGGARAREYDEYRRGPPPPMTDRDRYPPPPPPPADFRGRYPPPDPAYRGYPPPPPPPPPPGEYDRYDRRPNDRAVPYPPGYRPRSPPRPQEYDRPPRDYPDYRGRPASPVRYAEYGRVGPDPTGRYRRRSESPRPMPGPPPPAGYDPYTMNGYVPAAVPPVPGPIPPPRGARDYPAPPPRNVDPVGSYRRP